jgi:predicted nucleotidyltransferase
VKPAAHEPDGCRCGALAARPRRRVRALQGPEGETVRSAYLFGSHAEGRAHRESDIDVGVLLDRRALPGARDRFETALRLSAHLQSAVGTRHVDLVVLNDVPPGLGRRVVSRGRRLICSDEEADHAFVRDALLRAADLEPFLRRTLDLKLEALAR